MNQGLKIFFILLYAVLLSLTFFKRTERTDLEIVQRAVKRMQAGEVFYRLDDNQEHTKPPLGTFLFLPIAHLPQPVLKTVWDVLLTLSTLCLFWILLKKIPWKSELKLSTLALLAFALTFNNWNSELRCGQFNVLFFTGMLLGALYSSTAAGAVFALSLMVKPTFLVFFPWVFLQVPNKKRFFLSATLTVVGLFTLYMAEFGKERFISDHFLYLETAPLSVEKHIERRDNHGLPSLLSSWNKKASFSSLIQFLSVGLSALIVWRGKNKWRSLALIAVLGAFLSPMAWVQNYTLALPFILFALDDFFSTKEFTTKSLSALTLISFFIAFQVFNPTTLKTAWGDYVWKFRLVDWLTLLSILSYGLMRVSFLRKRGSHFNPQKLL